PDVVALARHAVVSCPCAWVNARFHRLRLAGIGAAWMAPAHRPSCGRPSSAVAVRVRFQKTPVRAAYLPYTAHFPVRGPVVAFLHHSGLCQALSSIQLL